MWISTLLHPQQAFVVRILLAFLFLDILMGVCWNLKEVFICVSLVFKDVEYFLRSSLSIKMSSFKNSVHTYSPFINWFICFLDSFVECVWVFCFCFLCSEYLSDKMGLKPEKRKSCAESHFLCLYLVGYCVQSF